MLGRASAALAVASAQPPCFAGLHRETTTRTGHTSSSCRRSRTASLVRRGSLAAMRSNLREKLVSVLPHSALAEWSHTPQAAEAL